MPNGSRRDGTVAPHFLSIDPGQRHRSAPGLNNATLKIGTINRIIYPDETDNTRKNRIEYDVEVKERDGDRATVSSIYRRCITADMFGGIADFIEFTYRQSNDKPNVDPVFRNGSTVLLLCLHSDTNHAYIIGGSKHNRNSKTSNKERGHFFEFEFNGVNVEINSDGELTITFNSKTDIKGIPQDVDSSGTFIKIDKTGSIELNDNKATKIFMDKNSSDITIETSKSNININAKKDVNVITEKNINANVGGDIIANVKGKTDINVKKETTVISDGRVKIKAPLIEQTNEDTTALDGVVTGQSVDPFTGGGHIDFSIIVRSKKQ